LTGCRAGGVTGTPAEADDLVRLLAWACTAPSEALVRYCELRALEGVELTPPVLEIGCGNGRFASLVVGHVDRAVEADARNAARAAALPGVYGRVDHGDIRRIAVGSGRYATVFVNSVLSVVPDLPRVLSVCHDALRPGGKLVATVQQPPLYASLLSAHEWYVRRRYRQQDMITLRSEDWWLDALRAAGFTQFTTVPYMPSSLARLWDAIDAPASVGRGRYRLSTATRMVVDSLPGGLRRRYHRWWAGHLRAAYRDRQAGPACHLLIVASTRGGQ
jgi:SAM-dependent methyltransferase